MFVPCGPQFPYLRSGYNTCPGQGKSRTSQKNYWAWPHVASVASGILTGNYAWLVRGCLLSPHTTQMEEFQTQNLHPSTYLGDVNMLSSLEPSWKGLVWGAAVIPVFRPIFLQSAAGIITSGDLEMVWPAVVFLG